MDQPIWTSYIASAEPPSGSQNYYFHQARLRWVLPWPCWQQGEARRHGIPSVARNSSSQSRRVVVCHWPRGTQGAPPVVKKAPEGTGFSMKPLVSRCTTGSIGQKTACFIIKYYTSMECVKNQCTKWNDQAPKLTLNIYCSTATSPSTKKNWFHCRCWRPNKPSRGKPKATTGLLNDSMLHSSNKFGCLLWNEFKFMVSPKCFRHFGAMLCTLMWHDPNLSSDLNLTLDSKKYRKMLCRKSKRKHCHVGSRRGFLPEKSKGTLRQKSRANVSLVDCMAQCRPIALGRWKQYIVTYHHIWDT